MYFDLVIEGSKSINSLTTSKLVSMVKSSFSIALNLFSCKTKIKTFCRDNFLPFNKEQKVQKHISKWSVSSLIKDEDGDFGVLVVNMG